MPSVDLLAMLPVSEVSFMLQWQQQMSQQSGGTPRAADVGEELWTAKIGCSLLTAAEAREAEARIEDLRGSIGTFYVFNPRAPYPLADPNGATLGASTVTIYALGGDNKSLRLAGLQPGYVISRGDLLHFETGSNPVRRCLHKFTAAGVADGAGRTALLSVVPHIRVGAAPGLEVTLKKPAAEMFIVPGTYQAQSIRPTLGSLSFTALQVP